MTIPKFTEKYLKQIGYPIVRNNIISEEDILLHFGIITKTRKIRAVKYDIVKPRALKNFLNSLRIEEHIGLVTFAKSIEMGDDDIKKLEMFVKNNIDMLKEKGIVQSETKITKVPQLLREYILSNGIKEK